MGSFRVSSSPLQVVGTDCKGSLFFAFSLFFL